ncbi:hypothetical protein [Lentzea xinjiangensis]|uniref:hypothetical protein n=1 Tax=Lentzea xinjiangensis TaxID=402600 RepID=UPI0015A66247|nr:hypothetical protein [Lentzea xinjiangensis]
MTSLGENDLEHDPPHGQRRLSFAAEQVLGRAENGRPDNAAQCEDQAVMKTSSY